jgi:adenylate kinase family enzyme
MALVWVTGGSGVGKSTICERLQSLGLLAVDADMDGLNRWVDRSSGQVVADSPATVPAGWLFRYAWKINRADVETLAFTAADETVFLCGSAENEEEVRDLFDLVVCLVVDDETIRDRLLSRTNNPFGKHPEEMAAALEENERSGAAYRRLGATLVDGGQPLAEVAHGVLAAAAKIETNVRSRPAQRRRPPGRRGGARSDRDRAP